MQSAPLGFATRHPRLGAALGALAISQSSTLAKLSGGSPAVVTLFRGAVSLPFLWFIARREGHSATRRDRLLAVLAGGLFALDLHQMDVVGNHHNAVATYNSNERDEANPMR